jgi:hypothetical protein
VEESEDFDAIVCYAVARQLDEVFPFLGSLNRVTQTSHGFPEIE